MAKRYNHGSSEEQDPGQFGATELATSGSPVSNKAAAPPSAGQVLTATSPTESEWQDPSNAVDSVFGRTGAVVAQAGDYSAAFVDYDNAGSGLVATTVQAAIDEVEAAIPAPAPVDSVFGRTGAVIAAASDYTAAQVDYDNAGSGLVATTVQAAIDEVEAAIPAPAPVDSVFGRTGAVVAAASDYDADQVDYDNATSGLAATDVKAALDELAAAGGGVVSSVFGRTGAIVAVAGDYDADQVDYDNATSGLTATDVKAALDELAASGGGLDIAALTEEVPEAGDFLVFSDTSDGDNLKKVDWNDLPSGGGGGGTAAIDPATWMTGGGIWDGDDIASTSNNATAWLDVDSGQDLVPAGSVTVVPTDDGTQSTYPAGINWSYKKSAVMSTGDTLTSTLDTPIAADADVYMAGFLWAAPSGSSQIAVMEINGGLLLCMSNTIMQIRHRDSGGTYRTAITLTYSENDVDTRYSQLYEVIHLPGTGTIELWINGTLQGAVTDAVYGDRNAASTLFGVSTNNMSAPSVITGLRFNAGGFVLSTTIPTLEQRRGYFVHLGAVGGGGGGVGGTADALATTGADVDVAAAAPPTTGQVLTATSATTATWQTPSGGGGVTLLTPDVIVPGMEFFDEAGRVLSGSNLTSWVSDSTDMTLSPVSANPPVRNSGNISGFTAVADPRSVMFGGVGIDDFVELSGGNGLSGALDGAPWSTTQDIYIGAWCQLLGSTGSMIAVESLALAFNGGQMGAFIRRNLDGAFAKGRRSLPEVMDSAGYLELFYRRGLTGLDAVSAFAFNGVLMHNARIPTGLDYSLSVAPSNLYLGTDGAGTGDGAGALGVYRICLINNYMPTQTERMQLFNWASGNTLLAK